MAGTVFFGLPWVVVLAMAAIASAFAWLICVDVGSLLANVMPQAAFATAGISGSMQRPGNNGGLANIASRLLTGNKSEG